MNEPGRHARRLHQMLERSLQGLPIERSADRLEAAGLSLQQAAQRMRQSNGQRDAFEHISAEDFETLLNVVIARVIADDLMRTAQELDGELN